jgi:hypothetical protein
VRLRAALLVVTLIVAVFGAAQVTTSPASATVSTAPMPVVEGNRIVDSRTDKTFVPHGANWPSFEYACSEGWGYSQDDDTNASAAAMQSWGIDLVRIPLNEDCWLGSDADDYGTASGYKAAVQAWVTILNAHGIAVILDLHWSAPIGQHALGQYPMADAQSTSFWSSVATAYAGNPSVIFDLFNEPYSIWDDEHSKWSFQLTWDCWENGGCQAPLVDPDTQQAITGPGASTYTVVGMAAMVSAVRDAGASQPIMLGGLDYSNDLSGWLAHKPDDSQLIASWHNYPGQLDCDLATLQDCWTAATSSIAASVPIITGEFGETDGHSSYLTKYMKWADSNGIGYLAWAWWNAADLSGDAKRYALYTGPNFTPKAPEGTAYKAHLASIGPVPVPERTFTGGPLPVTVSGIDPGLGEKSTGTAVVGVLRPLATRARYLRLWSR